VETKLVFPSSEITKLGLIKFIILDLLSATTELFAYKTLAFTLLTVNYYKDTAPVF